MIQPLPGNMLIMARFWRSPTARYKTARPGQAPPPIGGGSCLSWPRVDIVSPETSKTFPVVRPLWRSATLTSVALQRAQLRPRAPGQRWLSGVSSRRVNQAVRATGFEPAVLCWLTPPTGTNTSPT